MKLRLWELIFFLFISVSTSFAEDPPVLPWARCHALLIRQLAETPFVDLKPAARRKILSQALLQLPSVYMPIPHTADNLVPYFRTLRVLNRPIDRWLGIDFDRTELEMFASLALEDQIRVKGDPKLLSLATDSENLQTPYQNLAQLVQDLPLLPRQKIVDLGSAYSRLAVVLAALAPQVHYWGVEQASQRVNTVKPVLRQLGYRNAEFFVGDVRDAPIPPADYYYVFNSFNAETNHIILKKLERISRHKKIQLVVFHGMEGIETFAPRIRQTIKVPAWRAGVVTYEFVR